jgi:hypothetical protein
VLSIQTGVVVQRVGHLVGTSSSDHPFCGAGTVRAWDAGQVARADEVVMLLEQGSDSIHE